MVDFIELEQKFIIIRYIRMIKRPIVHPAAGRSLFRCSTMKNKTKKTN